MYTWGGWHVYPCLVAVSKDLQHSRCMRACGVSECVGWRNAVDAAAGSGRRRVRWRSLPLLFAGIIGWLLDLLLFVLALVWLTAPSNPLGLDGWVACSLLSGVATLLAGWLIFVLVATQSQARDGGEHRLSSVGGVWWFLFALVEMCGLLLVGMLGLLLRPNGPPQWVAYLLMYCALLFLPTGTTRRARTTGEGSANQGRQRATPLFLYLPVIVLSLVAVYIPDRLWNRLHRTPRATTPPPRPARPARRVPRPLLLLPVFVPLLGVTVGTLGLLVIEAPGIFPASTLNTGQDITHSMVWAPDGRHLAFAEEEQNQLVVWDATSHRTTLRLVCPGIYTGVAWSPDGRYLVGDCNSDSNVVTVWDARTGGVVRTIGGGQSSLDYAWSPEGDTLALMTNNDGSPHPTIQLWNIIQGKQVATFPLLNAGNKIAWSPDGQWLAVAEMHGVRILSAESGEEAQYLSDDGNGVINIAWSPDSTRLLMATYLPDKDSASSIFFPTPTMRVSVWQVADVRQTLVVLEQPAGDLPLVWSPTGDAFAVADDSIFGAAQVYDARTGAVRFVVRGQRQITALAWSPDGQTIATSEFEGMIALWHLPNVVN